jgi:hypothetical protein
MCSCAPDPLRARHDNLRQRERQTVRVGGPRQAHRDDRSTDHGDALVDRVREVGLRLWDLSGGPRLRQHPQPLGRPFHGHAIARGRIHCRQVRVKLAETIEMGGVVDPFRDVVKSQVAHLAFDPGPIETNRPVW